MKIELAHDILARKVFEKASSEDKLALKIEQLIKRGYERYVERSLLMGKEDLEYIAPFLETVNITTEEQAFVNKSQAAIDSKVRRQNNLILIAIFVLTLLTLLAAWQAVDATKAKQLADANAEKALAAKQLADDNAEKARTSAAEALAAKQLADVNAEKARKSAKEALNQKKLADENAEKARTSAKEALDQKAIAIKKQQEATLAKEDATKNQRKAEKNEKTANAERARTESLLELANAKAKANAAVRLIQGGKITESVKSVLEAHKIISKNLNIDVTTNKDTTLFPKNQYKIQDVDDYTALNAVLSKLCQENHRTMDVFRPEDGTPIRAICIHPTKGFIASGDESGNIFIWDSKKENTILEKKKVSVTQKVRIRSLAFDAKGERLYVGTFDGFMIEYTFDGKKLNTKARYQLDGSINSIAAPKGNNERFVFLLTSKSLYLYDRAKERMYQRDGYGKILAFAIDKGSYAFMATSKGLYYLQFDYNNLNSFVSSEHSKYIEIPKDGNDGSFDIQKTSAMAITGDGLLAIGNRSGTVWIVKMSDILDDKKVKEIFGQGETEHKAAITSLDFLIMPNKSNGYNDLLLLSTSLDRTTNIWNVNNLKEERITLLHNNWVWKGIFWNFEDEIRIFTAGEDRTVRRWFAKADDIAKIIPEQFQMYQTSNQRK